MSAAVDPAAPVPAATLILTREAAGRLQVCLLRRNPQSGFMPGAFVFPGGQVDPGDGERAFWAKRVDLGPEAFAERLGETGGADGMAYAVAAVRETFEESRVLLAERRSDRAGGYAAACAWRAAHGAERGWFGRLMASGGWVLRLSDLLRWERWITPAAMPRRFDTRFFLAELPQGQECRPDMREATEGVWLTPREALAANLSGSVPLTPPGLVTLQELTRFTTVSAVLAAATARRWGAGVMPRLISLPAGCQAVILMPWDPWYGRDGEWMAAGRIAFRPLPAGAPFSRVWNDGSGVWRPVE
jgi:8-oxo-dGTP pyrophosphatase MutT (NUDIX family)